MIRIFDGIIPNSLSDKIEEGFMHDDTNWNLAAGAGGYSNIVIKDSQYILDTHQMYHSLVADNQPMSQLTSIALCVMFFLDAETGIFCDYIMRAKANLLFPLFENNKQYHPPHIDHTDPKALSMVYYINDSDGPTRFFDNDGNIIQTVQPKKGRLVLFPSNIAHASSCPIQTPRRMVINYVFLPKVVD